jgi:hypothetical protein
MMLSSLFKIVEKLTMSKEENDKYSTEGITIEIKKN